MRYLLAILATVLITSEVAGADEREPDHQALRQLFARATSALNDRNVAEMAKALDAECSLTFVDETIVHDAAGLEQAFTHWFGAAGELTSVHFAPKVERGTVFTGPDTGWISGVSEDVYTLKDGRTGTMPAHWTATVVRRDGAWKISTLHASVDPQRNVILAAAISTGKRYAMAAGIFGAIVGLILGALIARRR